MVGFSQFCEIGRERDKKGMNKPVKSPTKLDIFTRELEVIEIKVIENSGEFDDVFTCLSNAIAKMPANIGGNNTNVIKAIFAMLKIFYDKDIMPKLNATEKFFDDFNKINSGINPDEDDDTNDDNDDNDDNEVDKDDVIVRKIKAINITGFHSYDDDVDDDNNIKPSGDDIVVTPSPVKGKKEKKGKKSI